MALSCGGNCLKCLVIFFSVFVIISGIVTVFGGIVLILAAKASAGTISVVLPAFFTTFGILFFIVGFLGCFGACYNNAMMLKMFGILLGVVTVADLICGIIIFVYSQQLAIIAIQELKEAIQEFASSGVDYDDLSMSSINELQINLKCCGGEGPSDWGNSYPPSCCVPEQRPCDSPYKTGCAQALQDSIKNSALAFGLITFAICLVQIGTIICAFCLAKSVSEYEKV